MPSLSHRSYLIPIVRAASITVGTAGCFSGSIKGEWTLVEVDGKDADAFVSFGLYEYSYSWYGYYGYGYYEYDAAPGRSTARSTQSALQRIHVDAAGELGVDDNHDDGEDCEYMIGLELELDIDERDGDDYEGDAEGGPVFSVVCGGDVVYSYTYSDKGDVEAESEGKGKYEVSIELDNVELDLECEVDGDEMECEIEDNDVYASELVFSRG